MYNKELNITEEDLINESDYSKLRQMRVEIEHHLSEVQLSFSKYSKLSSKQRQYISSLLGLRKICKARISCHMEELKEKGVWKTERDRRKERHLASIFMEEAKMRLSKEMYKEILEESKKRLDNN